MKRLSLVIPLISVFIAANAMADVTATATATASWDASATKDTTSMLVVTPLNSLTFQYSEALNAFNTENGAFDVTIKGKETATDFKLEAKIIGNTLTNASGDASTLNVGVAWIDTPLSKSKYTTLVDTTENTSGLENLLALGAFNGPKRVSDRSSFKFTIASATTNGKALVDKFSELPDGYWTGDVKVQFNATWTTPSA